MIFRMLLFGLIALALLFAAPMLDDDSNIYANDSVTAIATNVGPFAQGVPVLRRLRLGGRAGCAGASDEQRAGPVRRLLFPRLRD